MFELIYSASGIHIKRRFLYLPKNNFFFLHAIKGLHRDNIGMDKVKWLSLIETMIMKLIGSIAICIGFICHDLQVVEFWERVMALAKIVSVYNY